MIMPSIFEDLSYTPSLDLELRIDFALRDDKVLKAIEVYKTNGGKTGDAKIDDVRVMDIIVAWDAERGGDIKRSGLNEARVLRLVNARLRKHCLWARSAFQKKVRHE